MHWCPRPLERLASGLCGGRSGWAHRRCARINIELTILPEKAEENPDILDAACFSGVFGGNVAHRLSRPRRSSDVSEVFRRSHSRPLALAGPLSRTLADRSRHADLGR